MRTLKQGYVYFIALFGRHACAGIETLPTVSLDYQEYRATSFNVCYAITCPTKLLLPNLTVLRSLGVTTIFQTSVTLRPHLEISDLRSRFHPKVLIPLSMMVA